jgi:hypothetical protein
MCLSRNIRWADMLRHALRRVYEPTTRVPVPWLLTGEAALALQGVELEPKLIEFRAISPFAVAYFSGFMKPYEAAANAATVIYKRGGALPPSEHWRSNVHQRVVAWSRDDEASWLGRWNVDGLAVQVFHTRGTRYDPLSHIEQEEITRVRFEGMDLPVAPLEFLLAESATHGQAQTQTTNRILHALRASGYDADILNKALDAVPSDKASRLLRLLEIHLVAG